MSTALNPVDRFLPATVRKYLHGLLPVITVALVAFGLDGNAVALWVAAVGAALGAGIAAFNTASVWRQWLYGLLVPAQALTVYYGAFTEHQAESIVVLLATILGQGIAAAHTPAGE
jgi:hypothetical protein